MTTIDKIKKEWKKAFVGKRIYDVIRNGERMKLVEVGDALMEIEHAYTLGREEERKEIIKEMKQWWDKQGYWTCSANEAVDEVLDQLETFLLTHKK